MIMDHASVKARVRTIRSRQGREAAVVWGLQHGYKIKFSRDGIIISPLV